LGLFVSFFYSWQHTKLFYHLYFVILKEPLFMKRSHQSRSILLIMGIFMLARMPQFLGCSSEEATEPKVEKPEVIIAPQPSLYFGHIPQGQSATREFIISNTGAGVLNISNMLIEGTNAGLFTLVDNPGQIEVPAYKNITIPVKFTPGITGDFSAYVTIQSNAASSPDQAQLTGAGSGSAAGSVYFERIIGGVEHDGDGSIRLTINDGYIVAGSRDDSLSGDLVASILRLDTYGNTIWYKQYPAAGLSDIVPAEDGGYVAVGQTSAFKIYAVKTTEEGEIVWEQSAYSINGGSYDDIASAIGATTDGGYIIAGHTKNVAAGGGVKDALLVKIDGSGTMEWYKTYGTAEGEEASSVQQTADNGFIFTGSQSTGVTGFDVYLVKTSADGTVEWAHTYGGTNWDNASSVILADGGGYIVAGYSIVGTNGRDVYLLKTDADGGKKWEQTYGGGADDAAAAVIRTNDQGYLLVGTTESYGVLKDVYIIKTDNTGNRVWEKTYGGTGDEGGSCARMVKNEGYVISGTSSSYSKDTDVYVLKIDNTGMIP
jgi:hypothetical protein